MPLHFFQDRAIPEHTGPFRPLFNQVMIVPRPPQETASGLVIPESAREAPSRGTVAAIGDGHKWRIREHGTDSRPVKHHEALPVNVGDEVLFAPKGGEDHIVDGVLYRITPIEHVIAVLEP